MLYCELERSRGQECDDIVHSISYAGHWQATRNFFGHPPHVGGTEDTDLNIGFTKRIITTFFCWSSCFQEDELFKSRGVNTREVFVSVITS